MTQKYFIIGLIILTACNGQRSDAKAESKADTFSNGADPVKAFPALKMLHYDYAKDPACGMPLTAGLQDTTTFKGKLYGFCSKECKDAFLKDPASYIAKIKQ